MRKLDPWTEQGASYSQGSAKFYSRKAREAMAAGDVCDAISWQLYSAAFYKEARWLVEPYYA